MHVLTWMGHAKTLKHILLEKMCTFIMCWHTQWQKTHPDKSQLLVWKKWYVSNSLRVHSGPLRSSLFSLNHHWWKMGSTGLGRCMNGGSLGDPGRGTGHFCPGLSYARQAEGNNRGNKKRTLSSTTHTEKRSLNLNKRQRYVRSEKWHVPLQSSRYQSSVAGFLCCRSLASLLSLSPTPWISGYF